MTGSASISRQDAGRVIEAVMEAVSGWNDLALQYEVPSEQRRDIHRYMSRQQRALSAVTVFKTPGAQTPHR